MEPLPQELQHPELNSLEQQLRAFVPQAPQSSREQLLYQAGWEAALAQQAATGTATPALPDLISPGARTNSYWAAACAALLLLSTALGWRVWQQPQPGLIPNIATTTPQTQPAPKEPAPMLANKTLEYELEVPRLAENQPSALANYLELRQRVTRGGLSMWPVSKPVSAVPHDAAQAPTRDWQAELLREAL